MQRVCIHPEVAAALAELRPVVALESAVLTSGLPRTPLEEAPAFDAPGWSAKEPANLEIVRLMQRTIRELGAISAIVAVVDGALHIGLEEDALAELARDERAGKCAINTLAAAVASGTPAGTTVSATLHACALAGRYAADGQPIRVFATGGIGGVHRGWTRTFDVSADLLQLASTPVCVVCAGAKSILDVAATLEALQSLGVPVLGYGTDIFPQFFVRGDPTLRTSHQCDTVEQAAGICRSHWHVLGCTSGIVLANPLRDEDALDAGAIEPIIESVEQEANETGMTGAARTPFLLQRLATRTGGRSLQANLALLAGNAALAGKLAVALADDRQTMV